MDISFVINEIPRPPLLAQIIIDSGSDFKEREIGLRGDATIRVVCITNYADSDWAPRNLIFDIIEQSLINRSVGQRLSALIDRDHCCNIAFEVKRAAAAGLIYLIVSTRIIIKSHRKDSEKMRKFYVVQTRKN